MPYVEGFTRFSDELLAEILMGLPSEHWANVRDLHRVFRAMEDGGKWSFYFALFFVKMILEKRVGEAVDELLPRFMELSPNLSEWPQQRDFFKEAGKAALKRPKPTKDLMGVAHTATKLRSPR